MNLKKHLLSEARENPDDWKKNFITLGNKVYLVVQVIAAENDGWRAEYGISHNGKVIESSAIDSTWSKSFEGAVSIAKSMAKKNKIKWNPKPYGDRK